MSKSKQRTCLIRVASHDEFTSAEREEIARVLREPERCVWRGWSFRYRVDATERANVDVTLHLRDTDEIESRFGKRFRNFSVTEIVRLHDPRRCNIFFDRTNWTTIPDGFEGTLRDYRKYLIRHEIGHAIGFGHVEQRPHTPCNVMWQQTRGTRGRCRPNQCPTRTDYDDGENRF